MIMDVEELASRYDVDFSTAQAYAWGREDASNVPTFASPHKVGSYEFAAKFAEAYAEYYREERYYMVDPRTAYNSWQATAGQTIFTY
jgi:hypothetical protein